MIKHIEREAGGAGVGREEALEALKDIVCDYDCMVMGRYEMPISDPRWRKVKAYSEAIDVSILELMAKFTTRVPLIVYEFRSGATFVVLYVVCTFHCHGIEWYVRRNYRSELDPLVATIDDGDKQEFKLYEPTWHWTEQDYIAYLEQCWKEMIAKPETRCKQ